MVWAHALLQELYDIGLRGNLPVFVQNFLKNRTIQVKLEGFLSSLYHLDNGLPQGSIISVTLFLIAINKMFSGCNKTINKLFCDDGAFWARDSNLDNAALKIQDTLDKITTWSKTNGLNFSSQKSNYCIFTHKKTRNLKLYLNGVELPRSFQVRYLGMTLDHRLNWVAHIKSIKDKCHQRLSILRCASNRKWGADRKTLRLLYIGMIQSLINYASFLYGTAHKDHLATINSIQYAGIRIINGALKCTRTTMLEAEALIMPLNLRRQFLGLTYLGRTARLEKSLTSALYKDHYNFNFFDHRKKALPWIGQAKKMLEEADLNLEDIEIIESRYLYNTPKIKTKFTMHTKSKENLIPIEVKAHFQDMLENYAGYQPVFTDGSVKDNKTGCAVHIQGRDYLYRLPDNTSVYTAELFALSMAIDKIEMLEGNYFLICCDSLGALQTLNSGIPNSLALTIINKITTTVKEKKEEDKTVNNNKFVNPPKKRIFGN